MIPPETAAWPTRRPCVVVSAEESEPPEALGPFPPMSKVKLASERPNTRKTATSAAATATQTMIMMTVKLMARP